MLGQISIESFRYEFNKIASCFQTLRPASGCHKVTKFHEPEFRRDGDLLHEAGGHHAQAGPALAHLTAEHAGRGGGLCLEDVHNHVDILGGHLVLLQGDPHHLKLNLCIIK